MFFYFGANLVDVRCFQRVCPRDSLRVYGPNETEIWIKEAGEQFPNSEDARRHIVRISECDLGGWVLARACLLDRAEFDYLADLVNIVVDLVEE